jgi:hypothetical protein
MHLSDSIAHFPGATISGGVANQPAQSNRTGNQERRSEGRFDEHLQVAQQPLSCSLRAQQNRPPPIKTGLHRSQTTLTTRRERSSGLNRFRIDEVPPSVRMTKKRALDSAGLDEIDHLPHLRDNHCPSAADSWTSAVSSHICLCQPDPKIPRPRNGEYSAIKQLSQS